MSFLLPGETLKRGVGGGLYDRDDAMERNEWNSDDEEFDEFGRRKKGRKKSKTEGSTSQGASSETSQSSNPGGAMMQEQKQQQQSQQQTPQQQISQMRKELNPPRNPIVRRPLTVDQYLNQSTVKQAYGTKQVQDSIDEARHKQGKGKGQVMQPGGMDQFMNQQQISLGMPQTGAKVSASVGLGMNQQQMTPEQLHVQNMIQQQMQSMHPQQMQNMNHLQMPPDQMQWNTGQQHMSPDQRQWNTGQQQMSPDQMQWTIGQQQMYPDQMQWGMQEMMQNMQYMMNTMQQGMTSERIQQPTPQMQQMEQQIGKGTSSSGQWFSAAEQPITRFKMVPCKYWPGSCTRGASCAFLHNPALAKQEAAKAKLVFPQDNFIDFETGKKKEKPGSDPVRSEGTKPNSQKKETPNMDEALAELLSM